LRHSPLTIVALDASVVSRRRTKRTSWRAISDTAPAVFAIVASFRPYEPNVTGAPGLPEAGGCSVASRNACPPANRTVSPGFNAARLTREMVRQACATLAPPAHRCRRGARNRSSPEAGAGGATSNTNTTTKSRLGRLIMGDIGRGKPE
jgi:hypothetical protein